MLGFDKKKVLEIILQEVPVKQNLVGEIEVNGKKRVVYAYYFNRGMPDPDLKYDRYTHPIPTTPDSTLCEVYSVGGPKHEKFEAEHVRMLKTDKSYAEDDKKRSEEYNRPITHWYQGPWVDGVITDEEVIEATRGGAEYSFHHSESWFSEHFNSICERMGFNMKLRDDFVVVGRKKQCIGIDLGTRDPILSQVLDSIERAYQKIKP
ncbi:MAG: hypothetical protein KKB21_02120 [Nanoarchaeota archaeon]|nr:hypothetical protein [Nanoarchaeota archaeon]MBU4086351.1 hypothetical protein [Nanoarchaeota archaeon]